MSFGKLHIIAGPMFSGKTTELIRIARRYLIAKKKIAIFKNHIDDRFSKKLIVTHDQKVIHAHCVNYPYEMQREMDGSEVAVFFDEIQFFDKSVLAFIKTLMKDGIDVWCSGLDKNYLGAPFELVASLLADANEVVKLTAICECGEDATETYRKGGEDAEIVVGAEELYCALCRDCHNKRSAVG